MLIQYASDLHLEFAKNKEFVNKYPILPKAEILVLAGDIALFNSIHKQRDFLNYVSDNFKATYWIPGNHEYYYSNISTTYSNQKPKRSGAFYEEIRSNVFLLNNTVVQIENASLICSTLWTKIGIANQWEIQQGLTDFHVIKFDKKTISVENYNDLHEESLSFIRQSLIQSKVAGSKTVVVSHHVPTYLNYPEAYKGSSLNEAFAVELFDFISDEQPDYWIYGHSHGNTPDFEIGKTKLVTNQLGYVHHNEHLQFNPASCIDV